MASTEEKLDVLSAQMESMLSLMETFNRWCPDIDNFATSLSKDHHSLTSRVEALEAKPSEAPPMALKRKEEGRAVFSHGVQSSP